jgi:hypothetical protein
MSIPVPNMAFGGGYVNVSGTDDLSLPVRFQCRRPARRRLRANSKNPIDTGDAGCSEDHFVDLTARGTTITTSAAPATLAG